MRKIHLILVALMLGMFACKAKTTTCVIAKTYMDGQPNYYLQFNDGKISSFDRYNYATSLLDNSSVVHRQSNGKVDHINMFSSNGNLFMRTQFSYDSDGNLGALYTLLDSNNDGFPESSAGHLINTFDANNHLISTAAYDDNGMYITATNYTWTGENITRVTFLGGNYINYVYDDIKSVNTDMAYEMYGVSQSPLVFSANNVTQTYSFDAASNPTGSQNFSITYNSEGWPEIIAGPFIVESFEYTCTEE